MYTKNFDRLWETERACGGKDTYMYFTRRLCSLAISMGDLCFAKCAVCESKELICLLCLPTYLPTVHPFPCHAIGRSHILRCCLDLRYFALLLCALHKAWQCAFPIERDTCTYIQCTCAPRRVFVVHHCACTTPATQRTLLSTAAQLTCMHSLYSAVQYRRSVWEWGRGHSGGIRPWRAHVHPPFRYITTAPTMPSLVVSL